MGGFWVFPGRGRRRRRGPPRGRRARARRGGRRDEPRARGARRLQPLDHARAHRDPLRHPLLRRSRAGGRAAARRRRGVRRPALDRPACRAGRLRPRGARRSSSRRCAISRSWRRAPPSTTCSSRPADGRSSRCCHAWCSDGERAARGAARRARLRRRGLTSGAHSATRSRPVIPRCSWSAIGQYHLYVPGGRRTMSPRVRPGAARACAPDPPVRRPRARGDGAVVRRLERHDAGPPDARLAGLQRVVDERDHGERDRARVQRGRGADGLRARCRGRLPALLTAAGRRQRDGGDEREARLSWRCGRPVTVAPQKIARAIALPPRGQPTVD